MIKLLPLIIIILLILGFAFILLRPRPLTQPTSLLQDLPITSNLSVEDRIKTLETSVTALLKQARSNPNSVKTPNSTNESRLATLEASVSNLQNRINSLEKNSQALPSQTPANQTSTSKSPLYIPLGSGSSSSSDWTSINTTTVTINPSDYPGYTSMQLETSLNIFQTGTAYARLYNKDDGTSPSEVSTTSTSDTLVTSPKFTLPASKKNYLLQVKSQISGYNATASNARIKVNFN